jgi:uncharacterized membrane protein YuzA (DUF378 family)
MGEASRLTKGYLLVARALQVIGGLSALITGLKGLPTAALIFGIGALIDLMVQILVELRAQQVMILGLLAQKEEKDESA